MFENIPGYEFSAQDRTDFLDELEHVARSHEGSLGGEATASQDEETAALLASVESLRQEIATGETIRFSPVLQIVPLKKKLFTDLGLEMPAYLRDLMRRFDFYLVNIPITLFPKEGWGFTDLQCGISMNPDRSSKERPVAYQIFPEPKWETVIQASQHLQVGLDENPKFRTPKLPAELTAKGFDAGVGLELDAGASLLLGPFDYTIRRPKVQTAGLGDVDVRWRLEGDEYFQEEPVKLGLVMQTPKDIGQVNIAGAFVASKSFPKFSADVKHLMRYLRERTQNFFKAGAPIVKDQIWQSVLPDE